MTGKRNGSKQILRHIDVWDMAFVLSDNVIVFIKKYSFLRVQETARLSRWTKITFFTFVIILLSPHYSVELMLRTPTDKQ